MRRREAPHQSWAALFSHRPRARQTLAETSAFPLERAQLVNGRGALHARPAPGQPPDPAEAADNAAKKPPPDAARRRTRCDFFFSRGHTPAWPGATVHPSRHHNQPQPPPQRAARRRRCCCASSPGRQSQSQSAAAAAAPVAYPTMPLAVVGRGGTPLALTAATLLLGVGLLCACTTAPLPTQAFMNSNFYASCQANLTTSRAAAFGTATSASSGANFTIYNLADRTQCAGRAYSPTTKTDVLVWVPCSSPTTVTLQLEPPTASPTYPTTDVGLANVAATYLGCFRSAPPTPCRTALRRASAASRPPPRASSKPPQTATRLRRSKSRT